MLEGFVCKTDKTFKDYEILKQNIKLTANRTSIALYRDRKYKST